MNANNLPQAQLVSLYLDALAQLATGYKRQLTSEALARLAHRGKRDLFHAWAMTYPEEVYEYDPLSQSDISRLSSLLSSIGKLLTKFMPDLKAIDIHDSTSPSLSPQEQAQKIAAVLQRAESPITATPLFQSFVSHLTGAPTH